MNISKRENTSRGRRIRRIRKKIFGTSERPRLCVRRSLKHIYAQIVDDEKCLTIVQIGSTGKEFGEKKSAKEKMKKSDISKMIGELLAEKAKEKGVTKVVFDRKGYLYHGRVKSLADGARSKGLVF